MELDAFRDVCRNLPGSTETYPFGPDTPVFKASNGKVFAILSTPGAPAPAVTLKCDPEDSIALRSEFVSIIPGYHMNKRHWLTVPLSADVPDELLVELVTESHRLVKPIRARSLGR